jgi:hypothetical protein
MRSSRLFLPAVLGLSMLLTPNAAQAQAKQEIKSISYADLGKEIRALRGKVVVVYFWSFG